MVLSDNHGINEVVNNMNLYKTIEAMLNADKPHISMHVPGHKNNTIGCLSMFDARFDMTETDGLDDLHEPDGVLKNINMNLSLKYPGYTAQMMVNGTTNGVLSAVFAMKSMTDRFIVVDDVHKSVYHALKLSEVYYIEASSADLSDFETGPGDTFIVTYPTYTGDVMDIDKFISFAHEHGARVITDEAHGAHFDIAPGFPVSSMTYGSDITIQSYHKMLPALTMASVIFTKSVSVHREVMKYINWFETSSPSYLVMLSIESAHEFYKTYHAECFFAKRTKLIEALRRENIIVSEKADPAKFMISHPGFSPYEFAKFLTDQHHIHHEMVTDDGILWCLPLFHKGDRYPFDTLLKRIGEIELEQDQSAYKGRNTGSTPALTEIGKLLGRVCCRSIVPYPPGVPLVHEGETITREHIKRITHDMYNHVRIEGIRHNIEYYKNEES